MITVYRSASMKIQDFHRLPSIFVAKPMKIDKNRSESMEITQILRFLSTDQHRFSSDTFYAYEGERGWGHIFFRMLGMMRFKRVSCLERDSWKVITKSGASIFFQIYSKPKSFFYPENKNIKGSYLVLFELITDYKVKFYFTWRILRWVNQDYLDWW